MFRGTKNHNLIDNMNMKLAQTQKKISDVKRKCTETAKTCLQMHAAENVSIFIIPSCAPPRHSNKVVFDVESFKLRQSVI